MAVEVNKLIYNFSWQCFTLGSNGVPSYEEEEQDSQSNVTKEVSIVLNLFKFLFGNSR